MRPYDIIHKKRDGKKLTAQELEFLIEGYTEGEIPDYQLSAWAMAAFFQGLDKEETASLTEIMAQSGDTIDLSSSVGLTFNVKDSGSAIINKGSGSGGNALDLANVIKKDKVFDGATVMDKYQSMVSSLGVEGQRANQMVSNQETLVNQLENQRQSISGVSLDEEMSQMIKYQQAYNAAAKLISNADRMLDSLMSIIR